MRDRAVILGGLALFLAAVTWPAWRTVASTPSLPPDLPRPVGATRCVAPTASMRASHMTLLAEWRDRVVRDGVRTYIDGDGREVAMSLSETCVGACHTDKAKFCDRCHDYARVTVTCWNCHVAPPPPAAPGGAR